MCLCFFFISFQVLLASGWSPIDTANSTDFWVPESTIITGCITDSALSSMSWWHGWTSGQLRVCWDWIPANRRKEYQDLSQREWSRSPWEFLSLCGVITPTGGERGIVSVTAGLFVLKTGSVDSLITNATKLVLVVSQCYAGCSVGWGRMVEQ